MAEKSAALKVEFELTDLQASLWKNTTVKNQNGQPVEDATPTLVARHLFLDWLRTNASLE